MSRETYDDLELARQDTTLVNVGGVRLEALVVTKDLAGRSSGHGGNQKRVANTMLLDVLLQTVPVPAVAGLDVPHVVLKDTLADWRSLIGLIGSLDLCNLARGLQGSEVESLKDVLVQLTSLGRVKWIAEHHKGIGKTLNTQTNGAVTLVALLGLGDGVVVAINDFVHVLGCNLDNLVHLVKVEALVLDINKLGQSNRSQVADSDLIRSSVLDNFCAEVGASNCSQVLLVRLCIACI